MDCAGGVFIRATRRMRATLGDTPIGRGFTSFAPTCGCRPYASVTPVCISMTRGGTQLRGGGGGEAEGRSWERFGLISRRGPRRWAYLARGRGSSKRSNPSSGAGTSISRWCRTRWTCAKEYRNHKGLHGGLKLEDHTLKLGAGGIRKDGSFAQTRQLAWPADASLAPTRGTVRAGAPGRRRGVWSRGAQELVPAF